MTLVDRFLRCSPFQLILLFLFYFIFFVPSQPTPVYLYISPLRPNRGKKERNDLTELFWAENLSSFKLYFSNLFEAYPVLKNQSLIKCHRTQAFIYFSSSQVSKIIRTNTILKLMLTPEMKELDLVIFRIYSRC